MTRTMMAATARSDMTPLCGSANVAPLRPREAMAFDQARLAEVCDSQGHRAEAYIACVLDEVEAQVAEAASRAGDAAALGRICRDLVVLSEAIGMMTMELAARALLDCLAGDPDHAARAACLHRLLRLGRPNGTGGWELTRAADPDTVA